MGGNSWVREKAKGRMDEWAMERWSDLAIERLLTGSFSLI